VTWVSIFPPSKWLMTWLDSLFILFSIAFYYLCLLISIPLSIPLDWLSLGLLLLGTGQSIAGGEKFGEVSGSTVESSGHVWFEWNGEHGVGSFIMCPTISSSQTQHEPGIGFRAFSVPESLQESCLHQLIHTWSLCCFD
jgi:hypothetical protein